MRDTSRLAVPLLCLASTIPLGPLGCGDDADGEGGACDRTITADTSAPTDALLDALINARAGDVICLEPGT